LRISRSSGLPVHETEKPFKLVVIRYSSVVVSNVSKQQLTLLPRYN
jgi:hypothetical protein